MRHLIAIVVLALFVAACGDAGDDSGIETTVTPEAQSEIGDDSPSPSDPTTEPTEPTEEATTTTVERSTEPGEDAKLPEAVPEEEKGVPVVGEVPEEMMSGIIDDLNSRTGATEADATLVRAERAVWNDGSLGCSKPGEMYTQALVNGFWVVFDHAGETYDYRASESGFFKMCEGGGQPPSNPTG